MLLPTTLLASLNYTYTIHTSMTAQSYKLLYTSYTPSKVPRPVLYSSPYHPDIMSSNPSEATAIHAWEPENAKIGRALREGGRGGVLSPPGQLQ